MKRLAIIAALLLTGCNRMTPTEQVQVGLALMSINQIYRPIHTQRLHTPPITQCMRWY